MIFTHAKGELPVRCIGTCQGGSTEAAFVLELRRCGKRRDLKGGRRLHSNMIESGYDKNTYVSSALVTMYSKCGSMQEARKVFAQMIEHNVILWNALILGYVENGESSVALNLFNNMDCAPNGVTFVAAVKACAALAKLDKGTSLRTGTIIHRQAKECGFENDVFVQSTLMDMYSKCGDMLQAREVFDRMKSRTVVSWNILILGYVENGESLVALDVFNSMDCAPNHLTYVAAIKACTNLAMDNKKTCLQKGMLIHRKASEHGFDRDMFVASTLVDLYSKCGDMLQAREVFDKMVHKSVVSWTTLILGYVENEESSMALDVFNSMDCPPDSVTFVAALRACAALASENKLNKKTCLQHGVTIHGKARKCGFDKDPYVANTLVDMYGKLGEMFYARDVFDRMVHRSVVSWTALILGYVENGKSLNALNLFESIDCAPNGFMFVVALKACASLASENKLDKKICLEKGLSIHREARERGFEREIYVASTLVDMYSKCGDMLMARYIFDGIESQSVVCWNSLIRGYVENGESSMVLDMFESMDCAPDVVTFVAVLKACARRGALEIGQRIHERARELGLGQERIVANCLVDFFGKCGDMTAAEEVFSSMSFHTIVSWNALIGGYSLLGNTSQVFSLVKRMQEAEVQMNSVTMLLILTACSHAGMVEEGESYFKSMSKYGISPGVEHYTCMVDMLARANRLQEAISLLRDMPFEASGPAWMTLLEACRKWQNLEIGKVAFHALVAQNNEEDVVAACVLMRNIYKSLGMQNATDRIEAERKMANKVLEREMT